MLVSGAQQVDGYRSDSEDVIEDNSTKETIKLLLERSGIE
jgi:hypothetical protein